jgi:hypothetical protein
MYRPRRPGMRDEVGTRIHKVGVYSSGDYPWDLG